MDGIATQAAQIVSPAAGGGLTVSPTHYWDLDDDGVWADSFGSWDWSETGTVTVSSGTGPGGQDVASFDLGNHLTLGSKTWDGARDHISVSAWFKIDALDTSGTFVFCWRDIGPPLLAQIAIVNSTNNYPAIRVYDSAADDASLDNTGTNIATGAWQHIVLTWDGTTAISYINNSVDATVEPGDVGAFSNSAIPLRIGEVPSTATYDLDGQVAMVGIWDEALTSADVSYLYNSGNGRQSANL